MNKRVWLLLVMGLMFFLLFNSTQDVSAQRVSIFDLCEDGYNMLCVPDLVSQFNSLPVKGGAPLAFSFWHGGNSFVGRDAATVTHYQGINRFQDGSGDPWLVLTRNGNPATAGKDYPGEIIFVKLKSKVGEASKLGSNCASPTDSKCQPGSQDWVVQTIDLVNGVAGPIGWKHPGSGQVVENYLFVPLEKTCDSTAANDNCDGDEEKRGAIAIIDLIDKYILAAIPQDQYGNLPTLGTLAVTKTGPDTYLLAAFGGAYDSEKAITFWEYMTGEASLKRIFVWNANTLLPDNEDNHWRCGSDCAGKTVNYQMMNFLRSEDGTLYFLATDNDTVGLTEGADWAKLFKVERSENQFTLTYIAEKHLYLSTPMKLGDLDAAAGVYVGNDGRLLLYTAPHDNDGWQSSNCSNPSGTELCKALQLGEFASTTLLIGAAGMQGLNDWIWLILLALAVVVGGLLLWWIQSRRRVKPG